jgi:hypothetical protein
MGYAFSQLTEVCRDTGGFFDKYCLPVKVDCECTWLEGILTECDDKWNCNLCDVDQKYFSPFVRGDKIMIQTAFFDRYNEERQNPTAGFDEWILVELCDSDGNVLSASVQNIASRYWVGWACGKSYQTIEIDTSLDIFPECWSLRFTVLQEQGFDCESFCNGVCVQPSESEVQEVICTQDFQEVLCDEDTFLIESSYGSTDCGNHCYQEPEAWAGSESFAYTNKWRFYGYLLDESIRIEKQKTGNKHRYVEVQEFYRLVIYGLAPPYVKNILVKQILAGMDVKINGEDYMIDNFTLQNEINFNNMFKFDVTGLYRECENKNSKLC